LSCSRHRLGLVLLNALFISTGEQRKRIASGLVSDWWQNRKMKRPFSATVWREGDWFVSQCLDVDVSSQGSTEEEALTNLREALELHFEPPVATRSPAVRRIEVEVGAA
jgi:predicted RNase H-like HicB family nuclease